MRLLLKAFDFTVKFLSHCVRSLVVTICVFSAYIRIEALVSLSCNLFWLRIVSNFVDRAF